MYVPSHKTEVFKEKSVSYLPLSPWCLVDFLPFFFFFLIILKEYDSYLEREMDFEWRSSALWNKLRTEINIGCLSRLRIGCGEGDSKE